MLPSQLTISNTSSTDPLLILPRELVHWIFNWLEQERWTGLLVSKAWRGVILGLPIWHTLSLRILEDCRDAALPYLGPGLRQLKCTTAGSIFDSLNLFARHDCRLIKEATITSLGSRYGSLDSDPPKLSLEQYSRIISLGENLTRLSFHDCSFDTSVLFMILHFCRRLVYLTCDTDREPTIRGNFDETVLMKDAWEESTVQYLRWPGTDGILDPQMIPRYCPQLKGLWIHSYLAEWFDERALEEFIVLALERCQHLNQLIIDDAVMINEIQFGVDSQATTGLKTLFYPSNSMLTDAFICNNVIQNADTLEQLQIAPGGSQFPREPGRLAEAQLPRLQHLEIHGSAHDHTAVQFAEPLHEFLLGCPNLTVVNLSFVMISDLLMTLLSSLRLHTFSITECVDNENYSILYYIQGEANKGKQSALKKLSIQDLRIQTDHDFPTCDIGLLLPYLGSFCTVEHLYVNCSEQHLHYNDAMDFAKAAKKSGLAKSLKSISVNVVPAVLDMLKKALPSTIRFNESNYSI